MTSFQLASLLVGLAALFGFINHLTLRLPASIGLLLLAFVSSLLLLLVDRLWPGLGLRDLVRQALEDAELQHAFLDGMLSFLLFAAAFQIDLNSLLARKWTVLALSTVGVLLATLLLGLAIYPVFRWVGLDLPLIWCFVLGAILAPTDPVAISEVLGRVGLRPALRAVIAGESLFNDGVGVVTFTILLALATGSETDIGLPEIAFLFLKQAGGGLLLGLAAGWLAFAAMRSIDKYDIELMICLALVMLTYSIAAPLGVSGPIAVVVAGLIIGDAGVRHAMSRRTRHNLELFWLLIDEILNALLFMLIGLELLVLDLHPALLVAAAAAVPLALLVRGISVLPGLLLHLGMPRKTAAVAILTWGGLRGGICIALALTLPAGEERSSLLAACYAVVVFTIVVQGLTLEGLARRLFPADQPAQADR